MPSRNASKQARRTSNGRRDSLTAVAYGAIKEEILNNRLASGEPVPIGRFVRELRLSRTPVREAVLQLAKEGLIDVRPRMGTFVSYLDLRQVQEMYDVRSVMEAHAAGLAAGRIPADKLEAVERLLRRQKTNGKIDCQALSDAGQALHRLIVECCGNRTLTQMILSLQDHFIRFRSLSVHIPDKVVASHEEHLEILNALKNGDAGAAAERMRDHLAHAGRYLLENLLRPSGPGLLPTVKLVPRS